MSRKRSYGKRNCLKDLYEWFLALKRRYGRDSAVGYGNYANMVSESLNGTMEIYDLVR